MLKYQPSKMQAAEGFWEKQSQSPAPYYWFIVPDQKDQRNRFALATPYLGSIWLTHSLKGRVEGLKNTPRELQPKMVLVFYAFRIMYCLAMLMFAMGVASLWLRFRGALFNSRWFLWMLVFMSPSGIIATLAGWYVAETGRQPWVIFGILKTVDAVSPVPSQALLSTLIAFVCVLCHLHNCLRDLYIPDYSPRACGSSCLRRSVWFYKERIPALRARQSETIGG
jgi:cytochrome d ubiquinol oxidase subunit I